MLSFFPRGVLDEILNFIGQFLRVFLPTFTKGLRVEASNVMTGVSFL